MTSTKDQPGGRSQQRLQTQEALLEAAIEVFTREGYAAATVGQIAAAAGTSRPSFYTHFAGKAAVAVQLLHDSAEFFESVFSMLFTLDPLSRDAIRDWIVEAIGLWDPWDPIYAIVQQAVVIDSEVREISDSLARRSLEITAEFIGRQRPDLSSEESLLYSCRLVSEFHVIDRARLFDLPAVSPVVVDALADSWWRVIRPSG